MKKFAPCLALTLSALAQAETTPAEPPLYSAVYTVSHAGIRAAESTVTLRREGDEYVYESITRPAGFVAMFRSDEIVESSRFRMAGGQPVPLQYRYVHAGSDKNRNASIRFDPARHVAESDHRGERRILELPRPALDRMLMQVALTLDAAAGKQSFVYPILDRNEVKTYRFHRVARERLVVPAGTYETIRLERLSDRPGKKTVFWLAPALDFVPVRMDHHDPDRAATALELVEFSRAD
ncbi:MAG TPA: DUF3108 domain-containing protein [Gammaproteobacteria bacterium]|nr:DUF3108 domain-containing protein [Gammaproteobacteria bacterium]